MSDVRPSRVSALSGLIRGRGGPGGTVVTADAQFALGDGLDVLLYDEEY